MWGPSRRRSRDAPAALKKFVRRPEETFSTVSPQERTSALTVSRPAQASHTLRPIGSLSRLKRPLSRGFSPSGYPAEPLVSYQLNRQLSGWILPPQVIRAFGAHCHLRTHAPQQIDPLFDHLVRAAEQRRRVSIPSALAVQRPTSVAAPTTP